MSEKNKFCLTGSQIYPKPRCKNYKFGSRSVTIRTLRPNSAAHVQKSLPGRSSEIPARPKSANDIPHNEETHLNIPTKSLYFSKVNQFQKSPKPFGVSNCHDMKNISSCDKTQILSGHMFRNEDCHKDTFSSVHASISESKVIALLNKCCVGEADCLEISEDDFHRHKRLTDNSNSDSDKKKMGGEDGENSHLRKSKNIDKAIFYPVEESEIVNIHGPCEPWNHDMKSVECDIRNETRVVFAKKDLFDEVGKEENTINKADITSIKETFAPFLEEIDDRLISSSLLGNLMKSSSNIELPNEGKDVVDPLLSSRKQILSLNSEFCDMKQIISHPLNKSDENFSVSGVLGEDEENVKITCNCGSVEISSNSSHNSGVERASVMVTTPPKEKARLLKISKENLQENVEMLNIRRDSVQCSRESEECVNIKTLVRPSCVGESSGSWKEYIEMESNKSKTPCSSQLPIICLTEDLPCSVEDKYNEFDDLVHPKELSIATLDSSLNLVENSLFEKLITSEETEDSSQNKTLEKPSHSNFNLDFTNGDISDDDSTYDDVLLALKVLEKEEREPVLLSSRPPPTGSESGSTPRIKLKDILSFLDTVDQSCISTLKSMTNDLQTLETGSGNLILESKEQSKKSEADMQNHMASSNQILELRLQEQAKGLSLLKRELEETRQRSQQEKEKLEKHLKEEHATIVARHQAFIEKLLSEKKSLSEKCGSLVSKLVQTEETHKRNITAMEEHHALNLRNERERLRLEQRAARDKWMREKTQKIKAVTAKGAEGEVNRLVSEQAYQIEALWRARLDELRGRLEREAEEGMAKERETSRKRLEERVEEMERFHQEERRKFLSEECLLRGRAEEAERKVRDVEENARRRLADDLEAERARSKANLEKATEEMEKYYQIALSKEKAQREMAVEAAKKEEREIMEVEHRKWESKLRDKLRAERDHGIEKAVAHLSVQAEKAQQDTDARTEMTLRRMRERCDEQVKIAEEEGEKQRKQMAEVRSQSATLQEEVTALKTTATRLEKELENAHKLTSSLYEERAQIRDLVVEEWSARVATLREEVGILKAQIAGEKERREMELAQLQKEREHELIQVQRRVEIAVAKKEEAICHLKAKYETALKKCSQLQQLLEKQRKDLLLK